LKQERDSEVSFIVSSRQSHSDRRFRENLRRARTYGEWKAAAADLDQYLSNDIWSGEDEFAYYDYHLIRRVLKNFKTLRESGNVEELKGALEGCVKTNFGTSLLMWPEINIIAGIESPQLYSQTYFGTKRLLEDYIGEGAIQLMLQF
jgi:hypothetical protein